MLLTELATKDGKCPTSTRRDCSPRREKDECFLDSDCPGKQKCCDDACGDFLICKDPDIPLRKYQWFEIENWG